MKRKGLNKLLAVIVSASMILGTGIVAVAEGEPHSHSPNVEDSTFGKDEAGHWYENTCSCGQKLYSRNRGEWSDSFNTDMRTNHVYDNDRDASCNDCRYERHVHSASSYEWASDAAKHWMTAICDDENCRKPITSVDGTNWSYEISYSNPHEYDGAKCNKCGYTRDASCAHAPIGGVAPQYTYDPSDPTKGHIVIYKCSKCSADIFLSDSAWVTDVSEAVYRAHELNDAKVCSACGAPGPGHTHYVENPSYSYNSTLHWVPARCDTCSMYIITDYIGNVWIEWNPLEAPTKTQFHSFKDGKCHVCGYDPNNYECPMTAYIEAGHYEHDAEGHWFEAFCVCGEHLLYLNLNSETTEWSKTKIVQIHFNLAAEAGTTCDACGYTRPAPAENKEESKSDNQEEVKKDDAVTVAASVVEATTTVSADTVTLTPAIENALVQASTNAATPVVIDMTVASEIPATLVEKIAESEATVNLTLDTGVVLGLTSDTLDGTTAAPIVVKTVEPKMVVNLLTTTTNVPADKKLVVMNPVKGATMNNTAVIYQFYGPEAAGQVVNFYAADATGKFGVLATSVVFPNGYAAFVVPVVGFVGYAQ